MTHTHTHTSFTITFTKCISHNIMFLFYVKIKLHFCMFFCIRLVHNYIIINHQLRFPARFVLHYLYCCNASVFVICILNDDCLTNVQFYTATNKKQLTKIHCIICSFYKRTKMNIKLLERQTSICGQRYPCVLQVFSTE